MEDTPKAVKAVERLFPFVARARLLLVGRETLAHSKSRLQCVLISEDISAGSRDEVLREFADYPVVQRYTSGDFEKFFGVRNAKVLGLKKSSLAKSIYGELKEFRLNKPVTPERAGGAPARAAGAAVLPRPGRGKRKSG